MCRVFVAAGFVDPCSNVVEKGGRTGNVEGEEEDEEDEGVKNRMIIPSYHAAHQSLL